MAEFHELGLGEPHPLSAAHGDGISDLMDLVLEGFTPDAPEPAGAEDLRAVRVAVIGRPNVGKSTLINALLGEERLIAFDAPGTTRDAIDVPFDFGGQPFVLVDTAGIRRKGKVFETVEKFSVVKTLQAIDQANVVVKDVLKVLADLSQALVFVVANVLVVRLIIGFFSKTEHTTTIVGSAARR